MNIDYLYILFYYIISIYTYINYIAISSPYLVLRLKNFGKDNKII
ncbi:hypothetical protein KN1_27850 [Stygiolobus caldivivus]|uniref:Uncharacterized protein n=1 Tax=Stygiolobus caldivivus TaxID=2824673 RepID=A0A8D5ZH32_9CREN|nr:hypothetical protein KN1_27850 [Stygiolobus caldivivus]